MGSSIYDDIDKQLISIQQVLTLSNSLKVKCLKLEDEKNKALGKCAELKAEIERLNKKECLNCVILLRKLNNEKKEKEKLKKKEKEKLLKTIAKTLENMEDGNTDQTTNAHQLLTQLVWQGLDDKLQLEERKTVSLIQDSENCEEISDINILANETVIEIDSGESLDCNPQCGLPVVVPETELESCFPPEYNGNLNKQNNKNYKLSTKKTNTENILKENALSSEKEVADFQQVAKKPKLSPILTKEGSTSHKPHLQPLHVDTDETAVNNDPAKSPSILSEIIEAVAGSSKPRSCQDGNDLEEKGTFWKMKPNVLETNAVTKGSGRKLKQMTLSLSRPEKKHDISLSEGFKGGVAGGRKIVDNEEEEKDVILPSPERFSTRSFYKKNVVCETMEDPDLTVFQPGITSTCIPLETSFDRLPEAQKSPPYKYRRETVRKKEERMKLPGQDCDQCKRYYEVAGLDQSRDIRARMNVCSRHRDKHQIRANTPPGFWNPVMSDSPEGS